MIQRPSLRRALVVSVALHAVAALVAVRLIVPAHVVATELVDIEMAPPPPKAEALPAELAQPRPPDLVDQDRADPASSVPSLPGEGDQAIDAGVDAPVDARPDAQIDARPDARPDAAIDARPDAAIDARPDAAIDASEAPGDAGVGDDAAPADALTVATIDDGGASDAGSEPTQVALGDDAPRVALGDAGDAARVASAEGSASGSAAGPGSGSSDAGPGSAAPAAGSAAGSDVAASGSGSAAIATSAGSGAATGTAPLDTTALAAELGAAVPGTSNEPAVEGAPTTAGTAANLLTYFPDGHIVTALIRFDRLRGTEWAAQTERLLRPLPDYEALFGPRDAAITDKLETLVISTPRPRDAAATTLVARTVLARGPLRDFLGAGSPVTWSTARGGLLGQRTAPMFPNDRRVFLSPFKGWFLLAQPVDLGTLATAAKGNPNTVEATGKLPPWIAGIRKIESETGDKRGPAVVLTVGLPGKRLSLAGRDFGLGLGSVPTPERISLAGELVPQGWLVRGNLRFASDAAAAELVGAVQQIQQRVADSYAIRLVLGKPVARVIANLAFARNGARVSYATSMSIADARALLTFAALQLDQYFGRAP